MKSKLTPEQKAFLLKQKEEMRKQPKPRPIWRRSDVDMTKQYVLLLLENDIGLREFELREIDKKDDEVQGGKCIHITEVIPNNELVLAGNLFGIAETVKLVGGMGFGFDSNGEWYTDEEFEEFKKDFKL